MDELNASERRIADELGIMAGSTPYVDAAAVARMVAAGSPRQKRRSIRRLVVGAGAAIVIVVFVALLFASGSVDFDPSDAPAAGSSPAASSLAAAPVVTASPDPTAPPREPGVLAWSRNALPAAQRPTRSAVATLPTGEILVVGRENGRARGWSSVDAGVTWSTTNLGLTRKDKASPVDVIAWDGGFVVVGRSDLDDGAFVLSSPDGVDWERVASVAKADPFGVQATPEGLVMHGYETESGQRNNRYHPALFISPDGRSWETRRIATDRSPKAKADRTDLQLRQAARSDSGVWVVPGIHFKGGVPGLIEVPARGKIDTRKVQGLLWRSEDGVTWIPMELPITLPESDAFAAVFSPAITWIPGGFVMSLSTPDALGPGRGTLWHSTDGLAWEQVADTRGAVVGALVRNGSGVLAMAPPPAENREGGAAWTDQPSLLLESPDGRAWTRVDEPSLDRVAVRDASVGPDGRIVAIGGQTVPGVSAGSVGRTELILGEPG